MKISQLLSYMALLSSAVLAATVKNLAACVEADSNSLQISGDYCGAGTSATFTISATATVKQQCFNKANNQPQGKPKSSSTPVTATFPNVPLNPNGCVHFCFETPRIEATLDCGPAQTAQIVGPVTYTDVTLTGSNLPKLVTVPGTVSGTCTGTC